MNEKYNYLVFVVIGMALGIGIALLWPSSGGFDDLQEYCARADSPIKFEQAVGEYQMIYTRGDRAIVRTPIRFCPWTGRKLPESKRDTAFELVSREELRKFQQQAKQIRSANDARRIFGSPSDERSLAPEIKTQLVFRNVYKTFDILVQETTNGIVSITHLEKAHAPGQSENGSVK